MIFGNIQTLAYALLITASVVAGCKKKDDAVNPANGNVVNTNIPVDTTMLVTQANHINIQYSGRIDFSNTLAPAYSFPGISIKATFQGPAIDVIIKDYAVGGATTTNYYNVLIDGAIKKVLKVNYTDTLYMIARDLTDADHTIEVFKITEAQVGKSSFKGFRLRTGKSLVSSTSAPSRKIEFIGDSFTCGYGDEVSIAYPAGNPNTGFHSVNENNYKAWGAVVCRTLNAQYMCTAYSGRGVYRNNTGSTTGTVPSFYNRIHPDDAASSWTVSNYIPDVVVVHLGTNDFAPEAGTPASALDSASFVNAYISFVNTIRSNYPSADIICTVPNSMTDYYPSGSKWLTRVTNYHHAIVNHFTTGGDTKVHYFALTPQSTPFGEDFHPTSATQQSMSDQIVPTIKTIKGW